MADAKKCDRCGKYYDKCTKKRYVNGCFVLGIKIYTSGPFRAYDLCEDCVEDLYKFMNIDDKEKAVDRYHYAED